MRRTRTSLCARCDWLGLRFVVSDAANCFHDFMLPCARMPTTTSLEPMQLSNLSKSPQLQYAPVQCRPCQIARPAVDDPVLNYNSFPKSLMRSITHPTVGGQAGVAAAASTIAYFLVVG
jgi:hypothetical protein